MSPRRLLLSLILLAAGFAAGFALTGRTREASVPNLALPREVTAQDPAPPTAAATEPAAQAPAVVAPASAQSTLLDFTRIAERTVPAVVNISSLTVVRRPNSPFANDPFFRYFFGDGDDFFGSRRSLENSLGSGVIVSTDGYILTNHHVVTGDSRLVDLRRAPDITVTLADQREMRAAIVGIDPATDVALLKIDAENLPVISWGDSSRLRVAEWVLAIGNPYRLNQTVTLGIVSAVERRNVGISSYEDFIQTDAAINPGNSGGALVNSRGELVGINTAIFSESGGYQGIGFAVPSNLARRVAADLQEFGEVRRGSIGYVEIAPLTTQAAEELGAPDTHGVLVGRLGRNSPAAQGGLQPLDIIVGFNGIEITDGGQLSRLIQDAPIGSAATMTVIRKGRRLDLEIPIRSTVS